MANRRATDRPKDIAVLGCRHPHFADYVAAIERTPGVRLSCLWDRRGAAAAAATSGAAVLEPAAWPADVAAVIVSSETVRRPADVATALRGGPRPIFVEKPLGFGAAAAEVAALLAGVGGRFHTGFFLRRVPALVRLRALLREGALGSPFHASVRFMHDGARTGRLEPSCWLRDPALAGYGGFGDLGIHAIDLLRWLGLRPLDPVHAAIETSAGRGWGEHAGSATYRFPGGHARVLIGWSGAGGSMLDVELLGDAGALAANRCLDSTYALADAGAERS